MTYEGTTGQGRVTHSWAVACLSEEGLGLGAGLAWVLEKIGPRAGRCQIVGRVTELGFNPGQLAPLPPLGLLSLEQTVSLSDGETLQGRPRVFSSFVPTSTIIAQTSLYLFTSLCLSIRFPLPAKVSYNDHQVEVSVNDKGKIQ